MSNQDIGDQIDAVEATTRKVTVDVLAVKGQPRGDRPVRAEFATAGDLERKVEVRGRLFLTRQATGWRIFGYDVTKGRWRMTARLRWVRRLVTLAAVLAVAAVVVPDSAVKPTQMDAGQAQPGHRRRLPEPTRTSSGSWPSAPTPGPART